jgi:hypothetical protein
VAGGSAATAGEDAAITAMLPLVAVATTSLRSRAQFGRLLISTPITLDLEVGILIGSFPDDK